MASRQSELDRFEAVFAAAPVGLVLIHPDGTIRNANAAFADLAGISPQALTGVALKELVGTTAAQMLLACEPPSILELPLSGNDTEWSCSPLGEDDATRFFSVQNITLRKQQQTALRHSEERFRGMVRAVSDIVWTNNAAGEMEGSQPTWEQFTGQTLEQYQGYGWADAVHPEDAQPTIDAWQDAVRRRGPFVFEHRVRRHDGEYRRFAVKAVPILETDGSIREWAGVHTDISERRNMEQALRDSEGRLRLAQTAAGLGIWDWNFATGDLSWSRELHTLVGAAQGDTPSLELAQRFIHPEDRARVRFRVLRSLLRGKPFDIAFRVMRPAGTDGESTGMEIRWLMCRASVFPDSTGKPARALGITLDITAQKLAEFRTTFLLSLEDVIRTLTNPHEIVNSAATLLAVHLDAGRCSYIETDETLSHYNRLGVHTRDSSIDASAVPRIPDFGPKIQQALANGELISIEDTETEPGLDMARPLFRRMGIRAIVSAPLLKQGKPVAVLSVNSASPRRWTHQECDLILAVASRCWESIERARSEGQLARSEERLQQVFAQAPVAIVVFRGRDLVVEMANPHYEALVQNRNMVGRPLREILPELGSHVFDAFDQVMETGEPFVATDFHIAYDRAADGNISDHWFNVVYHPLRNSAGDVRGVVAVCSDVTAQVIARRQLERANRELEEFAYVASHDLQEPLRMIGIYAQLLTKRYLADDSSAIDYCSFIRKGVSRMEQLIEDLLSFSRTIHDEDSPGDADLNQSLQLALETLSSRIQETAATIVAPAEPMPTVRGDTTQFALVFQNLLSNSLKYARAHLPPRVEIHCQTAGNRWNITFADNGIGFEQIYAERIFGLFKRLHKDEYAGTGLGLAICQRVVSRNGGSIRAEGRPGQGSTFTIVLPIR